MFKKIMVPLDGSELAECVIPYIEQFVDQGQVESVVFVRVVKHIINPASFEDGMTYIPEDWGKPHFISFGIFFTGLIIELIVFYLSIYLSLMLPNDIYNESMSIESFSGIIIRVLIGIGSGLIFLGIFLIIYYENKKPSMKEKKRRNAENLKKCKNLVSQGRKELSLKEYTKALNNFRQALKVSEGLWDTDLTTEIYNLIRQTERLIFDGKM